MSNALATYLNDHLAGSAAGVQLTRRIARGTTDVELKALLERFERELEEDRTVLSSVILARGIPRDRAREAVALGAEWGGRVKHVVPGLRAGSDAVVALEDLELLSLGIEGRVMLLRALQAIADEVPLEGLDLEALEERARRQRDDLEPFRLRYAVLAAAG